MQKSKTSTDILRYLYAKRNARRVVWRAQKSKRQELAQKLDTSEGRKNVFRMAG